MEEFDVNNLTDVKNIEDHDKEKIDHYYKKIHIDKWLICDKLQKIRFLDRIEYKKNGKFHNEKGPAIVGLNYKNSLLKIDINTTSSYYIEGELKSEEDWKVLTEQKNIKENLLNFKK